jgi:hypothetical protein
MRLPDREHPTDWHFNGKTKGAAPVANFVQDRTIYVADAPYDAYRSMLYALGAKGVTNKLMANVDTIVHGAAVPKAAKTKYPNGRVHQGPDRPPAVPPGGRLVQRLTCAR